MPYAHPQQKRLGIYYNVPVMICIMPQSPAEADAEGAASIPLGWLNDIRVTSQTLRFLSRKGESFTAPRTGGQVPNRTRRRPNRWLV